MQTHVPQSWLTNHFALATKIAISIKAYAARQRMDVDDVLASLTLDSHWQVFSKIAGQPNDYMPSKDTQLFVRSLLHYEKQRLCIGCGLRMATREATRSGKPGTELCETCWGAECAKPGEARS